VYGRKPLGGPEEPDALERARPDIYSVLKNKYYFDEIYEWSVVSFNAWWSRFCNALDVFVWNGMVQLLSFAVQGLSALSRMFDESVVNEGFDEGCRRVNEGGGLMSKLQDGRIQTYLRIIGIATAVLVLILLWGCRAS
jgi:NADH-quinone oxidoreductase subunit L